MDILLYIYKNFDLIRSVVQADHLVFSNRFFYYFYEENTFKYIE